MTTPVDGSEITMLPMHTVTGANTAVMFVKRQISSDRVLSVAALF
ncbi:MAG: hypothetical protein ABJK21_19045 [Paracoccaceae bacterium]